MFAVGFKLWATLLLLLWHEVQVCACEVNVLCNAIRNSPIHALQHSQVYWALPSLRDHWIGPTRSSPKLTSCAQLVTKLTFFERGSTSLQSRSSEVTEIHVSHPYDSVHQPPMAAPGNLAAGVHQPSASLQPMEVMRIGGHVHEEARQHSRAFTPSSKPTESRTPWPLLEVNWRNHRSRNLGTSGTWSCKKAHHTLTDTKSPSPKHAEDCGTEQRGTVHRPTHRIKHAILPWIYWPVVMSNTKAIMFDTCEEESVTKLIETCCQNLRTM